MAVVLDQWFPNFFGPLPKSRYRVCLIALNKNFRISGRKFLLQWSLIILNNNVFCFCVTPGKIAYYPRGVIYPQFGSHCPW